MQESGIRSQEAKQRKGEGAALPVFDRDGFLGRCLGDEELVQEVLNIFLENLPQRIQELQTALDAADAQAARLVAHTIKGMSANTGTEALRVLAEAMEHEAGAGNLEAVRERMGELEDQLARAQEAIGSS